MVLKENRYETKELHKNLYYYIYCICITFFISSFLFCSALLSQVPSNIVDLKYPDLDKLDSISFYYVNLLRQEKKLPLLVWDDVLYRAAKDHADYLIHEENISHYQQSIEKSTPDKRVKIHGGIDYPIIGENIAELVLGIEFPINGKLFNTLDYSTTGKAMALLWKYSRKHYRNIISEKFNYSALATSYDSSTQRIIAVQVFGFSNSPPSSVKELDFSEYLLKQSRPKLPFGLKKYKYKKKNLLSDSIIPFPWFEKHPQFIYHDLVFKYLVLRNITDADFYFGLHAIGFSKFFPNRLRNKLIYNNLLLLYNSTLKGNTDSYIINVYCDKMMQREFYFRKYNNIYCPETSNDIKYYLLNEMPKFIGLQEEFNKDKYTDDLWRYYYLNEIILSAVVVPFKEVQYNYLYGFKEYFHPNDSLLTDEERLKYAYLYCSINKHKIAKKLIEPLALRDEPHIEGLKLYITLRFEDFDEIHQFVNYIITQYPRLGKTEWCDIWANPAYLNALLLEDLKLKNFYNCNCDE